MRWVMGANSAKAMRGQGNPQVVNEVLKAKLG